MKAMPVLKGTMMKTLLAGLAIVLAPISGAHAQIGKPTIVLVHGAFAGASSWNGVIDILESDGYPVVAVANPLRGVRSDADYVASIVSSIGSLVVLVGHSYGGSVISEATSDNAKVKALVYVSAFAPEVGETVAGLAGKFPGSTLGSTLAPPVSLSGGGKDLYIQQDKFHDQFAADVSQTQARRMAATQRPIVEAALNEAQTGAAWKTIPSWFIYGGKDQNIPPEASAFMAARAHSRKTIVIDGASHVVMVSNPVPVAKLIESAAEGEQSEERDAADHL
jgi:pimeloyl-ACP methyl ester carboxylesterase